MSETRWYKTRVTIVADMEVEAASMDEAFRIIDGILEAEVKEVTLFEGAKEDPDDEMSGTVDSVARDAIERVPE